MSAQDFFDKLNYGIRNSEQSIVNLLSAIGPWAAPIAPAFMSFTHMKETLKFPDPVAWSIAVVVEILGLSAVSTIISFWMYNKRKNVVDARKAPVGLAVVSFIFYMFVILAVNVGLDASTKLGWTDGRIYSEITARAMLALLSLPAALILAVRTQHKEVLDEFERERVERKADRVKQKQQPVREAQGGSDEDQEQQAIARRKKRQFIDDYQTGVLSERLNGAPMDHVNLAQLYEVSERTAFRWLSGVRGNGNGNGHGENN